MTDSKTIERLNLDELPLPPESLRQIQLERLQASLNRAARNVSHYHELFRSLDLLPEDITCLEDVSKLPLTERETLLKRQPYGMLAVAPRDVVRIHTALGPEGHPIVVASTANDIRHWTALTARALSRARVTRDDAVQISLDYNASPSALGMHYGAEAIGASVIPRSNIILRDQLAVMKNYRATVLVCTPSYARRLAHFVEQEGFDAKTLFLRSVILVDEPWTEAAREQIGRGLFANVYGFYGLDEVFSPGIAAEEAEEEGLFINEDHFLAEVIDPLSGQPVPEGQTGELVLTTLTKEALPLLRYRTGEIAALQRDHLEGGREVLRLLTTGRRTDERVCTNGSKFYPQQIGQVLRTRLSGDVRYSLVLSLLPDGDRVELCVEVTEQAFDRELLTLTSLKDELESELYLKFGITFHFRWVERDALKGAPAVQDQRELGLEEHSA